MRIKIDKSKCAGHNRCNSGYPEVFGISGEGESYLLNDGVVPAELENEVEYMIKDCPENAVQVVSD